MDKPVREEENKVVMSKIPRHEFANFKKLCDTEGKTVNKKLRELINQETNKSFGFPASGAKRKFFVPAENRVIEMWEIEG